jgi:hypothetical protein
MPVRQTAEPFTWQSSAPYARWSRATHVAVLCAFFAAGGYFLGRTVAAPGAKPLDRAAIEAVDRTAATVAHVAARKNTMATAGTDQSTSRPIAQPSGSPDRPSVVLLNPNTVQRSKEVGGASAGPVPAQKEPDDRGEGRIAKPAQKKQSVITKKPNRPVDEDTGAARSYATHPRVAVPRPSFANDDFRYEPRRYRDYRDLRGSMLRGE